MDGRAPDGPRTRALLCAFAVLGVAGALFGTPFSRPLGMVAAALLVGVGGAAPATAVRYEQLDRFGELTTVGQLSLASLLFGLGADCLALFALARAGEEDIPGAGPYGPYGPAWGQPVGQGGSGGFGPPPPSSPPPDW